MPSVRMNELGASNLLRRSAMDAAAGAEPGAVFVIEVMEARHGVRFR
jgi:hypothetical protein